MSLRIRRGTEAQRTGVTFEPGELVYTTDTKQLWVGDGVTSGGSPAVGSNITGYGLTFNASSKRIEVAGLTADDISNGINNKFFSTDLAQDATAALFAAGSHTNITFQYDDALNKINATVTLDGIGLTDIVNDTSPSLGGNLDINSFDVTGTGNISITGGVTATAGFKGDLLANDNTIIFEASNGRISANIQDANGNILFDKDEQRITLYNVTSAFGRFYGNQAGDHTSWLEFYSSNGTFASPSAVNPGDKLSGMILNSWNGTTYDKSVVIGGLVDGAVINNQIPGLFAVQNTNSTGNGFVTLTFNSKGVLSVPALQTGVYVTTPADARPTPAKGMIIFNDTSGVFEGYNGTAWVTLG